FARRPALGLNTHAGRHVVQSDTIGAGQGSGPLQIPQESNGMRLILAHLSLSLFIPAILLSLPTLAWADDWPQWLGPQRDGVWRETGILDKFPAGGPKVRWRTPLGGGYAGPAVVKDRVYVTDRILPEGVQNPEDPFAAKLVLGKERVLCLEES